MPELRFFTVLLYKYHRDKYKYNVTNTNTNTGTPTSYSAHPLHIKFSPTYWLYWDDQSERKIVLSRIFSDKCCCENGSAMCGLLCKRAASPNPRSTKNHPEHIQPFIFKFQEKNPKNHP